MLDERETLVKPVHEVKTADKDGKVAKDHQDHKDNEGHWAPEDFKDYAVQTAVLVLLVSVENQENKVLLV